MLNDPRLSNGEKLLFSLSRAFNLQKTNRIDKEAQDALAQYAEKIMEKRKKEREQKMKEQRAKQYAHKT